MDEDFFASEPRPKPYVPHPAAPWHGPPENIVGVMAPISVLVGRSDRAAIAVAGALAYPTGFQFVRLTLIRSWEKDLVEGLQGGEGPWGPSQGALRFGIRFADGRKATNLSWEPPPVHQPDIAMMQRGGGGGDRAWEEQTWVYPLPPPGPLTFACRWDDALIPLTFAEVPAEPIIEAARWALELWPEDAVPEDGRAR